MLRLIFRPVDHKIVNSNVYAQVHSVNRYRGESFSSCGHVPVIDMFHICAHVHLASSTNYFYNSNQF